MKKIIITTIIPLLFACSAKDANVEKENQLKNHKKELVELKQIIADLEEETSLYKKNQLKDSKEKLVELEKKIAKLEKKANKDNEAQLEDYKKESIKLKEKIAKSKEEISTSGKTQLKNYKNELAGLKAKISRLEEKINAHDTTQKIVQVKIKELQPSEFAHYIQITGNVEADKNIRLRPETSGNIVSIDVKEGQKVGKGEILARLNTSQIQRTIDEIRINLKLITTIYERQKNLWEQKIGSEIQFLESKSNKEAMEQKLEALEAQLDRAVIKAPFSGIVDEIFQKKGELASPQIPFAQLVNIDKIYVEGDVSETFLNQIKAGDMVSLEFPAINHKMDAPIYRTSNVIDPGNRSFKIRINLNNTKHLVKPNLISLVKIRDFIKKDAIVVPSILIKQDFDGHYLYIVKKENGNTEAKKIYVKVGKTYSNQSMIEEGLNLGDMVIIEGYAQVVNGTKININ